MNVLVTGSSGHLGEALMRSLSAATLSLLEESRAAKVRAFVFTSTTSTFGRALAPPPGEPAAWLTERVTPVPKNIYGVTKVAAESVCELFHHTEALPIVILRTSRFFPEGDDDGSVRAAYDDANCKVNEFLYRRVDLDDVVDAHLLAIERAPRLGFGRYIVSAPTPFVRDDVADLRRNAAAVVERRCPGWRAVYEQLGWRMFPSIDRVYDSSLAQTELGWRPRCDFATVLERFRASGDVRGELARTVGSKGYHRTMTER